MKKLKFLLPVFMSVLVYASCTFENFESAELPDAEAKASQKQEKSGFTIVIPPGSDPYALQNVLDQASAQPGWAHIQLLEGEYVIAPTQVVNFRGSITGAGIDKTIIKPTPGIDCDYLANVLDQWPALLKFIMGDVTLQDMSFVVNELPCAEMWAPAATPYNLNRYLGAVVMITGRAYPDDIPAELEKASSWIENVKITGIIDEDNNRSVDNSIMIGGEISNLVDFVNLLDGGNHTVTNCILETADAGVQLHFADNSKVDINNNIFNNIQYAAALLVDCSHSNIFLTSNHFVNDGSVIYPLSPIICSQGFFTQWFGDKPELSTFIIKDNIIKAEKFVFGSYLYDYFSDEGKKGAIFHYENNQLDLQVYFTGFYAFRTQNALIKNNKFKGTGNYGLFFSGGSHGIVLHNDFSAFESKMSDIALNESTSYFRVIGANEDVNIIDLGENNMVVGAKKKNIDAEKVKKEAEIRIAKKFGRK